MALLGTFRCDTCMKAKKDYLKKIDQPDPMSFLFTLSTHGEIFEFLLDHANHNIMWFTNE